MTILNQLVKLLKSFQDKKFEISLYTQISYKIESESSGYQERSKIEKHVEKLVSLTSSHPFFTIISLIFSSLNLENAFKEIKKATSTKSNKNFCLKFTNSICLNQQLDIMHKTLTFSLPVPFLYICLYIVGNCNQLCSFSPCNHLLSQLRKLFTIIFTTHIQHAKVCKIIIYFAKFETIVDICQRKRQKRKFFASFNSSFCYFSRIIIQIL